MNNTWEIAGLAVMMLTTSATWGLALAWSIERLVTGRWWWAKAKCCHAAKRQAGQAVTYNISARDSQDAFIRSLRQECERAAMKSGRPGR
ncbi:hypothetical protein [Mycobacteroides chelonae]|uniref:hypothetical protein n=1 Tax=Mycobacteroides chelonae TaxID=1774 RepID=UPI003875DB6F